jgi:hypothetical protein
MAQREVVTALLQQRRVRDTGRGTRRETRGTEDGEKGRIKKDIYIYTENLQM